jgi:hypothetical protein
VVGGDQKKVKGKGKSNTCHPHWGGCNFGCGDYVWDDCRTERHTQNGRDTEASKFRMESKIELKERDSSQIDTNNLKLAALKCIYKQSNHTATITQNQSTQGSEA